MYLEQAYLNTFLKHARLARGERKKIPVEDSDGVDDFWVFTENFLKVLYGN